MRTPGKSMTIELFDDRFYQPFPPGWFIDAAGIVEAEINRPEVREWIEASPFPPQHFTRLRHLLMVLRKSKVVGPRRLTWRERITGRVQA